eukprot:scaffold12.g8136.t1
MALSALQQAADEALASLLKEAALEDVEGDWVAADGEGAAGPPGASPSAAPREEADLPPAAAVRLYATRLRAAAADIAALQVLVGERDKRVAALEAEVQQLRGEAAAAAKERKALEAKAERAQRAAQAATEPLRAKEAALAQAEAERRASVQERRQSEAEGKARESRLAHALEEAGRFRRLLEEARGAAAARGDVPREEHGRVLAENRALQGQRQELATAFAKAMKLVGVLEQQKVHLQAGLCHAGGGALLAS